MANGIYTPSGVTAKNDSGVMLTYGTVTGGLIVGQVPAGESGTDVPHSASANLVYSGGTLNNISSVLWASNKTTLNGLANTAFSTVGLTAAARSAGVEYGRAVKITAMDYLTGTVTYASGKEFDTFNYVSGSGTSVRDVELASQNSPYSVPPKLVMLVGDTPQNYEYSVAN